jgi:pyruvate/2-oxoglutarate dehydrogenase complex dihydrolipoamide dehydrogenase (E3) component
MDHQLEELGKGLVLDSEDDRQLLANCHPPDNRHPKGKGRYNLVAIGGGVAGLVSTGGAGLFGGRAALVERSLLGGDCLTFGCVPSKAILRAARAVYEQRNAQRFGARWNEDPTVDFAAVMQRMRQIRARISEHDSVERMTQTYGVDVYLGEAHFLDRETIEVNGRPLRFSRAIIATGARPSLPAILGLREVGYETNETIFGRTSLPRRLVILGGGPIGCEMAQAFQRFGSQVTLVETRPQLLAREDRDVSELLERQLQREGVNLCLGTQPTRVERTSTGTRVLYLASPGNPDETQVVCDSILVATGRTPNLEGLALERAEVASTAAGVEVNDFLRTTNPRIYAAGDVCASEKFTHAADAMARMALRNALFAGRERMSRLVIPRCTYTDPEVAHIGWNAQASAGPLDPTQIETRTESLSHNDRAILDGEEEGLVRIHIQRRTGKIVGATIVARHAGELIATIAVAMSAELPLQRLVECIFPYPTQAEAIRRLADQYALERWGARQRAWLGRWLAWQRR